MGCVDSSAHTPTLFTNMKPALKERLRNIIARDDIVGLVEFDFAENCPYNVELSESGVRWTALHFCCRFDAPACLEYFLKKCFLEGARDYPFFVNQQTAEGLSCLHLCAMWSATRCLLLLLRYGALNISMCDNRHKTAQVMLGEYGMREMERLLTDFKAKEGFVTQWNFTLLQEIPQVLAVRDTQFYKEELAKMEERLKGKLAQTCQSTQPSQDQVRMREEKGRLQRQREEIHCELMKAEKMGIKQEKPQKGGQTINIEQQEKNQYAQTLSLRLKKKEQQIQGIKYNIQKLIAEKNDQLLLQQIHRIDVQKSEVQESLKKMAQAFQQFKYEILKNRLKYIQTEKSEGLTFLKDPNRKTITSESSSKYAELGSARKSKYQEVEDLKKGLNIDKNKFNRLPEHIQERYRKAKELGHFEDTEFAHNLTSLGGQQYQAKIKPFISSLIWLRPSNFICSDFALFDGIQPNDVKQGQLGVCYCLATISQYARTPKKIVDIFAYCDLQLGFYVLRFYTDGKPNYIVVDDYFPCNSVSQQPLFSKPIGNQIWVLLIQKAWAKIVGSYFAAQMMTPDLFMEDLTGSPTYGAWFKDKKDKMKDVIACSEKGYLIVLTTGSKRIEGIVNNHAYSLLKVIEHEGAYIYKLRNPWGRFEWNGCYGEKSTLWSPQLRQKCEEVDGDDGIFFLAQSQVLQAYDYYSIGLDEANAKYSYAEFKSVREETVYFKFTLHKAGMMAVRLTQPFKRIIKDKDYKYSPVVFQLGKIGDNNVTLQSEGNDKCYFGQKSVYATNEVYRQYEAGQYFVRLKVQWSNPQKYNSAILSVYCDEQVAIQRLQQQQGLQLWKKMLLGFIQGKRLKDLNQEIAYAMDWMRGQMICYSILKESSKLESVKVKWTFNANELQNCTLAFHKTSDTTLEFILNRTTNFAMGTLNRIDISKSCKSGNVSIQSLKQ